MLRSKPRSAVTLIVAVAASFVFNPAANATGFIVIDNGVQRPHFPMIGIPTRPGTPTRPPVLKGGVSFGLHLQSEDIRVDISDQVAKTYITQTFANDTDQNLAGTYLFPLPEDTTFSSFSLHIDGKPVEGKILEAQEARQEYEAIVRKMVDPGLLEYADYKTVRARIFPIPAHGTKKVELEYTQVLKAENGMLEYHFPLKSQGEAGPVDDVKVEVKLTSKQGIKTIWSPSHEIKTDRKSDLKATVAYNAKNTVTDKDFVLYYSISAKDIVANLLTHKLPSEDGYFILTITPPVNSTQVMGKDMVFVVDTSGSMQGEKLEQTKKALKYVINALHSEDRFGVLQFNTDVDMFKSALQSATEANKKSAIAWVDELEARGGTNIGDALKTGGSMLNEVSTRPAYVLMMTDGEPTVGETDINKLVASASSKRDVRVFDVGVGYDVNTKLLNKIAEEHHGTTQYVAPDENLETSMSSLYRKIQSPVLSNVKLSFDGMNVKDVYPREVKDIFAGSQIILIGKYKDQGKGTVHITGTVNGGSKSYAFPLSFSGDETGNTYLPRLWAMRRIGHLTDVAQENRDNREVVDEIVSLSKKYGIITAYTSFLVTEPQGAPMNFGRRGIGGGHGLIVPMASSAGAAAPVSDLRTMAEAGSRGMRFDYAPSEFALQRGRAPVHQSSGNLKGTIASAPRVLQMDSAGAMPKSLPTVGADAFKIASHANSLKDSSVVAANVNEAMKAVGDKTFYLINGVWTDSTYSEDSSPKPIEIAFGSDAYFKLTHENPGISKFLSVGKEVLFVFKGKCYRITAPVS